MTLNKIRLKSAFMMIYSISYWLWFTFLAFISIYTLISSATPDSKNGFGFVTAMSFLSIVVIAIFALMAVMIAFLPKKESSDYGIVTGGLELIKRKYKFVSHSELGYFIFIFEGY